MNTHIQYTGTPETDPNLEYMLCRDFLDPRISRLIPAVMRTCYIMCVYYVGMWFLGKMSFDELMDDLGRINDKLIADIDRPDGLHSVNPN